MEWRWIPGCGATSYPPAPGGGADGGGAKPPAYGKLDAGCCGGGGIEEPPVPVLWIPGVGVPEKEEVVAWVWVREGGPGM